MTKSNLGQKGFVWLTLPVTVPHPEQSGQELRREQRQGPWSNAAYWFALSEAPDCFPLQVRTTCPGTALSPVVCPQTCVLTNLIVEIPQWRFASSQVDKNYFVDRN